MDLKVAYNILLFWLNKYLGSFFTFEELDSMVDAGQLSYYKDCFIKYGTGQRLNDALSPFKKRIVFTTDTNGFYQSPEDYMDLIYINPVVNLIPVTCPIVNDDEIVGRLNSQVIPCTPNSPFAEMNTDWNFIIYPNQQYSGTFSYFKRPPSPKFVYTTVSGRIIVYDQNASTQLEWGADEIQPILIATLQSIGVNLSEADILQFAEGARQQDLLSTVKI